MKELTFPLLSADDIEVRIGSFNKEKTKCTLPLYQDARCGMKYLDQVVGAANWQKKYYELKGVIYCSLGININYDDPSKDQLFIWKDDAGAETQVESEKGQASDSFKRTCVCWGLARELYTAPTIWCDTPQKYTDFQVKYISYEERKIKELVIIAKNKDKNFQIEQIYPKGRIWSETTENAPKNANQSYIDPKEIKVADTFSNFSQEKGSITNEQKAMIETYVSGLTTVSHDRFFVKLDQNYGVGSIDFLSEHQANEILSKIRK